MTDSKTVEISVVLPVFEERPLLGELRRRLEAALEALQRSYEIILVDDGSKDGSLEALLDWQKSNPDKVVVVEFVRNFGQHAAVIAGMAASRGTTIVTLDSDLQNPPEEIGRLLEKIDQGHDLVRGVRKNRHDTNFRRYGSALANRLRARLTGLKMTDQGSMLAAYSRSLVEVLLASREFSVYIPALAASYCGRPAEVLVDHESRKEGQSRYDLHKLLRLNFDLITGFSAAPLKAVTMFGLLTSTASLLLVLYMAARRLFLGPEVEGVFTLFGIAFFLIGACLFSIGIMGEYVARIYQEVRNRPLYLVRETHRGSDRP